MDAPTWYSIIVTSARAEEDAALLTEAGASGLVIHSATRIEAYLHAHQIEVDAFLETVSSHRFTVERVKAVALENWTARCQELWEPLSVGALAIVPIAGRDQKPADDSGKIFIIPGTGFGTGHHATTAMVLAQLQGELVQKRLRGRVHSRLLDLGTGSGILALALYRLYSCPVEAIDNDRFALENAADNVSLNYAEGGVFLRHAELKDCSGDYDLIVANIYAEVLFDLAPLLTAHVCHGGILVLSGIAVAKADALLEAFISRGFRLHQRTTRDDWIACTLQRST